MVDEWEAGARVPTLEQVQALAELTGWPVRFFYLPPPRPLGGGHLAAPMAASHWVSRHLGSPGLDVAVKVAR